MRLSPRVRTGTVDRVVRVDPFHVSANTDPKGDRSKRPQEQDPDMLLHVIKETDAGIVVRGAKFVTAAAFANQAFTKPTIANWGDAELSAQTGDAPSTPGVWLHASWPAESGQIVRDEAAEPASA